MKIEIDDIKICECLMKIIEAELKVGNYVKDYNETPNWPQKNSRFVFLKERVSPDLLLNQPNWVSEHINNEMHYTWYHEIYCDKHQDLLAAGVYRP